ncbi:hypothetical protein EHS13_18695 [Paenibacillus psychroresistens]|uniref:Uncharacterized protein n=1 Tax=Paenibacillus psychroresistens TaxID=1778678 RepID=A0A6B8RK16_9BACL|nr:CBO0543 family protein [Paenibacillus psychroresistens]QGQ96761.1 hypothetical protein EHS13_18695 [Paenibacillus psychroresistens]
MTKEQQDIFEHLRQAVKEQTSEMLDYWIKYSNANTWQFWVNLALFVLPLIALYFLIDKRKALQFGFFGFNVHVWFTCIDEFGTRYGLWAYPYKLSPFMPTNFALDASFLPVACMLVYQWTVNHQKNRYLYLTILGLFISFIFKPFMSWLDLFKIYEWMNYTYLLCGYLIIMLISIWITAFFLHLQKSTTDRS